MLTNIISNCESQADSFLGNTDVTVRFVPFCLIEASTDFDDKRYHPNVKDYCQCSFSFVGNLRFYSAFVCTRRLNKTTCYCQFTLHNNPLCVFHFVVPPPSSLFLAPIIFSNITSSQVNKFIEPNKWGVKKFEFFNQYLRKAGTFSTRAGNNERRVVENHYNYGLMISSGVSCFYYDRNSRKMTTADRVVQKALTE